MTCKEYYINQLKNSDIPADAEILKLEENPNMKYQHTEIYFLNKAGEVLSDEEFNSLSKYKQDKCKIKSIRVYKDINNIETRVVKIS